MYLSFLPEELSRAVKNLNANFLTEIRIRSGQAVIIEYRGEYRYINGWGPTDKKAGAIRVESADALVRRAIGQNIFAYSEQLKSGFFTLDGGVRVGLAGEYVTDGGKVTAVKNITSLNIRIPHIAAGCGEEIFALLCAQNSKCALIFSRPGLGKTTVLRDLICQFSNKTQSNVLVFDERYELSGGCTDLGPRADVITGSDKLTAFSSAIRAMKPDIIICDELYGESDFEAVRYATACNLSVIASSHLGDFELLKRTPFQVFIQLTKIGGPAIVYDKAFNIIGHCNTVGSSGRHAGLGEKEGGQNFF